MPSQIVLKRVFFVLLSLTSMLILFRSRTGAAQSPAGSEPPAAVQGSGGPRAFFAEETYDFGSVMQGTVVEHDFKVANHGDAPLTVQGIQAACGCTVASYSVQPLAPGDSSVIKAKFDTSGFQGLRLKTLRVFTNDPSRPSATLTFKGIVNRDVEVSPARLYFGSVRRGENAAASVKLSVDRPSGIQIVSVESRSEFIEVLMEGEEGARVIKASLKSNAPIGVLRDRVVIKTTSRKNPVINLPVFARVEGDLRFLPSDVSFGLLEGPLKEDAEETVLLRNTSDKQIKIESVSSDNSAVSASVEKRTGNDYVIVVSIASGSSGAIKGRVTVVTDHPDRDQRELNLPVYGIISRKGA